MKAERHPPPPGDEGVQNPRAETHPALEGAHRRHEGPIPNVSKGPPRLWEVPTRCLEGPSPALEVPSRASRRAHPGVERRPLRCHERLASASKGPYPRVRGSPAGEERAAAPVRERQRQVEGGLEVCGDGRYSPTGRRRSAEPLLQGAGGRERSRHVRRWGGAGARARKAGRRREEPRSPGVRRRGRQGTKPTRTAGESRREDVPTARGGGCHPITSSRRGPLPMFSQRARSLYHLLPL